MPNNSPITPRKRVSSAWTIGAVLFAALLCLLLFWKKPPTVLPEVLSTELARRDGLLYHGNQSEPFTGFLLEKYPGGALKSRSAIRLGVLDGPSEGWHTNGMLQVREIFRKGISHGLRQKWYDNGTNLSEGMIVEGKHDGLFRRWHENGHLAEEMVMRQGEPDGLSRAFYPSGFLKAQVTLQDGKVVEKKSWEDGQQKESPALARSK